MRKAPANPQEVAEFVAIQALSFLASDPERLGQFLTESGIGPQTLRTAAADPKFLAGVLDFIVRDDATVKAFADASKLTPEAVANFTHEIRAMAALNHPRLAAALDAGQDGSVYYLVTEFVPGMHLRQLVREKGPLSMAAAASIGGVRDRLEAIV